MENLQDFKSWCVWMLSDAQSGSKPRKVPINPRTGRPASTNDPSTFGTFAEASRRFDQGGYNGLGVLMSSGSGLTCIDIDFCLDVFGVPNDIANHALQLFKGYNEVSQSGRGLHFFIRAKKPAGCKTKITHNGQSVEIYSEHDKRFLCVTGNRFGGQEQAPILVEQDALDQFLKFYGFYSTDTGVVTNGIASQEVVVSDGDAEHSDAEIMKLLKVNNKRGKISRLLKGDIADYDCDHSAADLALCSEIAYYTKDPEQLRRVFESSKLADREKWQRNDYRDRTISKALTGSSGYYWDDIKHRDCREKRADTEMRYGSYLSEGLRGLILDKRGFIQSCLANAAHILLNDHRTMGAVGYNEFSGKVEALRALATVFGDSACNESGEVRNPDITAIRIWLHRAYRMNVSKGDVDDAVTTWARNAPFNPVIKQLNSFHESWDRRPRLATWLIDYLGVDPTGCENYVRAIGAKFLIGMVARAFQPGCKMDTMLVLEGRQGAGKSLAVRKIAEAVYPAGFVEGLPTEVDSQEAVRAIRGALIVEMSELAALQGKASAEHIKSFISKQADTSRDPFARRAETWPRTCVFIGTTNDSSYIADVTGGRRFWGIKVGSINITGLTAVVGQLVGEAVAAYKAGETWHLSEEETIREATRQQNDRMETDTWDDAIIEWLEAKGLEQENLRRGLSLSMKEIFSSVFPSQQIDQRLQNEQRRFARSLRRVGFTHSTSRGRKVWSIKPERLCELLGEDAVLKLFGYGEVTGTLSSVRRNSSRKEGLREGSCATYTAV
jgi:predicted P-loop ATPase